MRIIAGKYKSFKLRGTVRHISPTKDNVKETIFNLLRHKVHGACVLDLFSGSGALGLEAISRGACKAVLIDKDVAVIRKNIDALGLANDKSIAVFKQDAFFAIKKLFKRGLKFDIIFLDPPYHKDLIKKCLHNLIRYDILLGDCWVIAEHESKVDLPQVLEKLTLMENFKYGQTEISIYKKPKRIQK